MTIRVQEDWTDTLHRSFFGEQTRARAAVSYTHADKFKSGYTIQDGIDVSQWNGNIDWKKVKKDGIDFALVRMAYRGYGTAGNMGIDKTGGDNLKNAVAAGVPVGAYIFSQATTESEGRGRSFDLAGKGRENNIASRYGL